MRPVVASSHQANAAITQRIQCGKRNNELPLLLPSLLPLLLLFLVAIVVVVVVVVVVAVVVVLLVILVSCVCNFALIFVAAART
ncbi:hypothetical protein KR222_001403 [Zaprionus bogoriensis]|nr:hypothetical protein KR222_001403 [Zaprionus bogoriensis]